ncbi:peptidyl-prolyl cis-trans isomerase [Mangrovimonas futianensis]|uniref:peptidyl-prolyl cis-trans isomerase n=1 Tax=Mangrovimonas futianensis TaxID=2895523 RepID=UPI001E512220|nr:peptidyl-prolyl cis-trans isomerase [Mangrovimonas futianensis]MCF1422418.1 peptidyl-prolyl cis-trans isomerase [Mangrovimonas futianensis]
MKYKVFILITGFVFFTSCNFFKEVDDRTPIARVEESFLYLEDLKPLVKEGMSAEDSTVIVNNFINNWATEQLLVNGAKRNLKQVDQENFDKLAQDYKNDLYSKAYLEALVRKNIDTSVTSRELESYYEENKEIFKLKEDLVKLRYVHLNENRTDLKDIERKFKEFNEDDKRYLDSISIQFKSYSLKDSVWVKVEQVIEKIPVITSENRNELLKKSNFLHLKDSIDLYLIFINDVQLRNSIAPIEYVKPTIDKIVINKRKLELIKELKKDISQDAIKNNKFEVYN